jgi:hypothetical protein
MGYLQDLQQEVRQLLSDLAEERQKEIVRWVANKVLESYRNGQANGEATVRLARASKGLEETGKRLTRKQQNHG